MKDNRPPHSAGVYLMTVLPENCDSVMEIAMKTAKHLLESVPGFLEARILASEDKTNVVIYAAWETRHDWSRSRWDEVIQETMVAFHRSTEAQEFRFYTRREVV